MSTFLIRSVTSQSSSYPIVLTRLGGPRSRPNTHLKFVEVPGMHVYIRMASEIFPEIILETIQAYTRGATTEDLNDFLHL